MAQTDDLVQDVMLVCRNGHVITDLLRSFPERALTHCDRCGATTMERCPTCGQHLPGAIAVPGLHPVGLRPPPSFCPTCGVAFPWTTKRRPPKRAAVQVLEEMLSRLPRVIRQLRSRHAERPPFRIVDEHDLADLLRAVLPLSFDDVRPESRTPRYAADTRTDFLLAVENVALTLKIAHPRIAEQLAEDVAYYRSQRTYRTLVVFVYDPNGELCEALRWDADSEEPPEVRCVVASG